jgi:hypothetical protein
VEVDGLLLSPPATDVALVACLKILTQAVSARLQLYICMYILQPGINAAWTGYGNALPPCSKCTFMSVSLVVKQLLPLVEAHWKGLRFTAVRYVPLRILRLLFSLFNRR